jgi:hypothetical protein
MKRVLTLTALAVFVAVTAIYVHNGRCFACDTDPDPADYCTRHIGPCSVVNASIVYDQCDSNKCPDCNTCDTGGTFTCCYNGQYTCNDSAHLGQTMFDKQCKLSCEANHQPGTPGGDCPFGMLCE